MFSMKAMEQALLRMIHEDAQEQGTSQFDQQKAAIDQRLGAEIKRRTQEINKLRDQHDKAQAAELARHLERKSGALERDLLLYRQQLLEEIFDLAIEKLKALSNQEFLALLQRAAQNLRGDYTVCLGEYSQGKLDPAEVAQITRPDGQLTLTLSQETLPRKSGFLLLDQRAEYSCLFEDLMEEKKNQQLAAIQLEAFSGDDSPLT